MQLCGLRGVYCPRNGVAVELDLLQSEHWRYLAGPFIHDHVVRSKQAEREALVSSLCQSTWTNLQTYTLFQNSLPGYTLPL